MSVEPPSSGRPTGPPSGPLSGPSQPPSGPPSQPSGSGGAGAPEPHRPWWKSAPRVAILTTAVVAAVVLAVVFTQSSGGSGSNGEVFLQAADKTGPDPFTESTATKSSAPPVSASPTASEPANAVRGVDGGAPGLYGGTQNVSSCDVERQVKALQAAPSKNQAFASVAGVQPSGVPAYLRALTPVQLRMDTRVTNHGYRNGAATSFQAVLQTGTAVLVDGHGVPRVRCACGNPLSPPVAQQAAPRRTGDSWPSYRPQNVIVVTPAPQIINIFVLYDPDHDDWFARHQGDTGAKDHPTPPPVNPPSPSVTLSPPTSPSSSSPSNSPSPCASSPTGTASGTTGTPSPSTTPCPPTSTAPSSSSPSSSSPSSASPSSESPSSKPPSTEPPSTVS